MSARAIGRAGLALALLGLSCQIFGWGVAAAQGAHHPFAIGANEGAVGPQSGLGAWLIGQESRFYLALAAAVRATRTSALGAATLIGLSFAYGIFHAAGPGHGKAVITLYMVSNERALRRGLVIALLAALLQASFAVAIVGIAALVFHATSRQMTTAATTIEFFSTLGVLILGLYLCWRKGWALVASFWPEPAFSSLAFATRPAGIDVLARSTGTHSRFVADDGTDPHLHGADCDCIHMPDPRALAARRFDIWAAAMTVVTAAAKPCSGAILVLVFALSQGVLAIGVASAYAMALGTAATTGALACAAVFAKGLAQRISGRATRRAAIFGRAVEFAAALCVLVVGASLFLATVGPMQPLGAARAQVISGGRADDAAYAPRPPARWRSPESQGEIPDHGEPGRDEPDVHPETPRER